MRSKEALQLRVLELCNQNNLTLHGLCKACGVTQSTLNNLTRGRNNSLTVSTINKICNGLNMELPEFFNSEYFRNLEQEVY